MENYILSRGIVESIRDTENNNKYWIRITPAMDGFEEINLLPEYPSFFKNHIEVYNIKDVVWVLHSNDFKIGYVLGLCENPNGRDLSSFLEKIQEVENKFKLPLSDIKNITFSNISEAFIEFSDEKTLISGRISSTGSSIIYGHDGSLMINSFLASVKLKEDGTVDITDMNETHTVEKEYTLKSSKIEEEAVSREINITEKNKEYFGGDNIKTVVGNNQEAYTKDSTALFLGKKKETIGLGENKTIIAGGADITIIAGDYNIKTLAGNLQITTAAGIKIIAGLTGLKIISGGTVELTAPTLNINALSIALKTLAIQAPNGVAIPSGSGPFCALPICLFTGVPHVGNKFVGTGV